MPRPEIRRRLVAGCLLLWATGLVARAHAQTRTAERAPDLPAVDFVALGADGRAAPDLTAADVTVKIDGRVRAIRALHLVTIAADAEGPAAPPAPFGSSSTGDRGRTLVLVVDDDSLRAGNEARMRQAVKGLLAGLTRRDRVSLFTMPYGGVKVPGMCELNKDKFELVGADAARARANVFVIQAAAALIDESGRIVARWTATDMDAAPTMGAMVVPTGTYRLRVAATDEAGRGGTADEQVVAALTPAGPLQLSTLVLGLSRSGVFVPTLEFGTEPVAIASFEIYGGAAGTPLFSALEVARTVDGPALAKLRLALERAAEGRYVATGAIPLGALPPGDFVRATVGIEGQPAVQIVRTLRKAPR